MINFLLYGRANRRCVLTGLLVLFSQSACSQQETASMKPTTPLSAEDAALKHKLRDVRGGELRVDSTFNTFRVVLIDADTGYLFNIGRGSFGPGVDKVSNFGGNAQGDRLAIPKHLRMMRYPEDAPYLGEDKFFVPHYEGVPIVDVTVPVAQRIPQEALDDLRKNGGGLRLKLRIHPETLLVGWDVERRPGYDPAKKDRSGNTLFVAAQHSSAGGDFREAELDNGQVTRKGWYIDPKTKQRVETDF